MTDYALSDRELTALCKSEIDKILKSDMPDCEVINKDINIDLGADSATVKGKITVLKDIGKEVPVNIRGN